MTRRTFGSIRVLTNGTFNARYTRQGQKGRSKTFPTLVEAEEWLRIAETASRPIASHALPKTTRTERTMEHPIVKYVKAQDAERGSWRSPRQDALDAGPNALPSPPFPEVDNPMMQYIITRADAMAATGLSLETIIPWVAAHGWMEGHIEGYDLGRWDTEIDKVGEVLNQRIEELFQEKPSEPMPTEPETEPT